MEGRGLFFGTFERRAKTPAAGWYEDQNSDLRYWNGYKWTDFVWSPLTKDTSETRHYQIRCSIKIRTGGVSDGTVS